MPCIPAQWFVCPCNSSFHHVDGYPRSAKHVPGRSTHTTLTTRLIKIWILVVVVASNSTMVHQVCPSKDSDPKKLRSPMVYIPRS